MAKTKFIKSSKNYETASFSDPEMESAATTLKALAHGIRLKILCSLLDQELSVNEMTTRCQCSQPSASQHLAKMTAAGLIKARREGTQIYYSVSNPDYLFLIQALCKIIRKKE